MNLSLGSLALYLFASLIYLFDLWISGFVSAFELVAFTFVFSVCVSVLLGFIRMIFTKASLIQKRLMFNVFLFISILHTFVYIFLFSFAFYQNSLSPGYLARITLSDGQKTLVFQQMSHIATSDFYSSVRSDIATYTSTGYTVYYEGVGTGSTEDMTKLQGALGIELDGDTYRNIAQFIGMSEQDYSELFAGLSSGAILKNIDIPLSQLIQIYDASPTDKSQLQSLEAPLAIDFSGVTLLPREQTVVRYLSRSMLNYLIKIDSLSLFEGTSGLPDRRILRVILDERNHHIAENILTSPESSIYALYGALHFEGIYAYLKQKNPKWNIVSIEKIRPY